MSADKLFVVAIDFGTTYSGYGFSSIHDKDQIYTYSWSAGKTVAAKTPTSILFNPRKTFDSFGYEAELKYASLSQQNENKDWYFFKRFKLTLYKNKDLNESTTISDYTGKPLPALKVFSAGIKFLKEHLFTHFQERIEILQERDIHWVLTVPAIWDEAAKKFMRKSAEEAGIEGNQLTLALEPESAALYCQSGQSGIQPMEIGDKFLLLDCGGGTVDVTVHEVRRDKSLKEIHRASGGTWGGIKVDDAFEEYIIDTFGYETIVNLPKNDVIELERSFESLKKKFGGDDSIYYMQIPMDLRRVAPPVSMTAGRFKLTPETAKRFFDKPIKKICEHIREILSSYRVLGLDTIFLVGGFSESSFLQNEIRRTFPRMNVFAPNDPASAVVKGAVEFGHCPEKIRFRLSPCTYGVDAMIPFKHGQHPISKRRVYDGEEQCIDIFDVHVYVNQQVETGTPISDESYGTVFPDQKNMLFKVVETQSRNPEFVTDGNCRIIGRFEVKLPDSPYGKKLVNVKMIFGGTELIVEARDNITNRLYKTSFRF